MQIFNDKHKKKDFSHICKRNRGKYRKREYQAGVQEIKEITGRFIARMSAVKDKQGKVLTEGKQVKARWKENTEEL